MLDADQEFGIYYVATPDGFLLTLDEALLKRHIDRRTARRAAKDAGDPQPAPKPYLGAHLNGHVALSALEQIRHLDLFDLNAPDLHSLCFANLPILNTWRRLYPDQDPVAVHERLFSVRLVCPAGGRYVWDDTWRTMASTVLGHPAARRSATVPLLEGWRRLRFGITFEHDGLRARVEMTKP